MYVLASFEVPWTSFLCFQDFYLVLCSFHNQLKYMMTKISYKCGIAFKWILLTITSTCILKNETCIAERNREVKPQKVCCLICSIESWSSDLKGCTRYLSSKLILKLIKDIAEEHLAWPRGIISLGTESAIAGCVLEAITEVRLD